jgi:hypothetical protein
MQSTKYIVTCLVCHVANKFSMSGLASVTCILGYAANNFWPSRM